MTGFYPMLGTYLGSKDDSDFYLFWLLTGRLDQKDPFEQFLGRTKGVLARGVDFTGLKFFSNTQINNK